MTDWWQSLELLAKIYWISAFVSSLLFIVILIMTFVGADTDELGDADFDGGIDFQFLTFKNSVGFFTVFSWSGLACYYGEFSDGITMLISVICGLAMMLLMAGIFYGLRNLGQDSTLKMINVVGATGEVYLFIGKNKSSMGKVHVKVQGSLRELDALTDMNEDIPTGAIITVKSIVSEDILLVEKAQ
jgi:hypothetical protein